MTARSGSPHPPAGTVPVRDASLYVEVIGHGYPLLLMHGGPGADHWTLLPFRRWPTGSPWSSTTIAATDARRALLSRR